ncbi:sodium- and chloride-dependent glycine transporter 2-like isoform X2 [Mytilus californianus]|nr:sodium- and chloride-dependent glycine transporter 2-like isoform X2 [Mytilus californianus]XP_052063516.1 sodium- and chloride-dependent glycine transporter 2-like isoform X2 [Mytilus californianus]
MEKSKEQTDSRETWSGRLEFLLSCAGYCIGPGNIWRFPYLCYKNGGGTFLIPYFIFMVIGALPMYFIEFSVAQFSGRSAISLWEISPLFKGTGYGMVILTVIISVYFNVTMAWILYYLYNSFTSILPWSTCNNHWNTDQCYALGGYNVSLGNETANNFTNQSGLSNVTMSYPKLDENLTGPHLFLNQTILEEKLTASEEFWRYNVLRISSGIDNMGHLHLGLLICLSIAWLLTFICVCNGIKVSGKVVYVTVTFPYIILLVLLIRAVMLPGASEGLKFYLIPKWDKLLSTQLWGEAALQIFFTSGVGWGTMITYASFNKFHHNIYRDSLIVPLMNSGTSLFAGFVTFSVLGFMAHEKGVSVEKVVTQGPGLTFVTYPEAISRLPLSPLWAVLFYLMLLTVAIDSQFGFVETINASLIDEFPKFLRHRKKTLSALLCLLKFILGIPLVMQGGIYVFQIMDWYCALLSLMVFSLIECIVIGWIYGVDRFYTDIEMMIGYKPCIMWSICWKYITPCLLVLMLAFNMLTVTPVSYKAYKYPSWAVGIGWIIGLISLIPIPVCFSISLWRSEGTLKQRLKEKMKSSPNWRPQLDAFKGTVDSVTLLQEKELEDTI